MKRYLFILTTLFFAACNGAEEHSATTDNMAPVPEAATLPDTFCYLRTEGTELQDSFVVKLVVDGHNVSGEMKYLPWQKDASIGTLKGTKTNNILKLTWTYWQEGMETMEKVAFKLEDDKAHQQLPAYNDRGEMYLPENAEYRDVYTLVDCSIFPARDY